MVPTLKIVRLMLVICLLAHGTYSRPVGSTPLSREEVQEIEKAIIEKIGFKSYGGQLFCVYNLLGSARASGHEAIIVYTIGATGEFTKSDDGSVSERSGGISPVVLKLTNGKVISAECPRLGAYYAPDIRRLFPRRYHSTIFSRKSQEELQEKLCQKVASSLDLPLNKVRL
jgi:hypothetical protein